MTDFKKFVSSISVWLIVSFIMYYVIVVNIMAFKNPYLTRTQLFLRIPDALMLDFDNKDK